MATLLFEIGTEELPAWYVRQGRDALMQLAGERLNAARLPHGAITGYATPRRLAIRVDDLADASERREERRRGPSIEVGLDDANQPTRAAIGFARGVGVDPSELTVEETERGPYLYATVTSGGVPVRETLPELLANLVRDLPAPRKMRWGDGELAFVRPVAWLLVRLDDEVVPVALPGLTAGGTSRGHRFLSPDPVEIQNADAYLPRLRDAGVLADPEERRAATRTTIDAAIGTPEGGDGPTPEPDDELMGEIVNLVERPHAILGRFDARYLALPDEVLATVMIHHQRFVPLRAPDGRLIDRFVGIAGTEPGDDAVVRSGYEAVLDGRLYDARFFWDADRGKTLAQHAWGLSGIAFQKRLGSMADKVTRVAEAAPKLAQALDASDDVSEVLTQALPLFRADLATEMVYELPELEGVMARAYAQAEGLPDAVAQALEDGLRPAVPGGALPRTDAGAVLAVADRADKLLGFFALGKRPSGSADPFALRRDAGAVIRIASARGWGLPLRRMLELAADAYDGGPVEIGGDTVRAAVSFVWDRATSLLAEEGPAVTEVRAAVAGDPSVILAARRAHLLRALADHPAFPELLALYKRAANLAERAPIGAEADPELFETAQEAPLYDALPVARDGARALLRETAEQMPPWQLGTGPTGTPTPSAGLDRLLAL
ncbi:MAG: glycine--tRNA ligase subunit beta, partial [Trueperaceae bacterium]